MRRYKSLRVSSFRRLHRYIRRVGGLQRPSPRVQSSHVQKCLRSPFFSLVARGPRECPLLKVSLVKIEQASTSLTGAELSKHPDNYSEIRIITRDPESSNCKKLL